MFLPRHMLEQEEFLSDIVKKELASYKKILKSKASWGNRLSKGLYLAAFLPPISMLILVLLAKLNYSSSYTTEIEGPVSGVYAVGGIVAALTGMLIAILAIASQLNSLYIGGSESVFRLLLSKTGYKPVAALAVGTIVGALIGCMYDGSEPYWIVFSSVMVLVFFGSTTAIMELMVLFRAVESFGREAARAMFVDHLKEDNRRALLAELKRRIAWNELTNKLKEMGFDWLIWPPEAQKGQVRYYVKKEGRFVSDVRFEPFRRLSRKWGLEPLSETESTPIGFLMRGQDRPIVCIWPGQLLESEETAVVVGGDQPDLDVQALIDNVFICRRRSPFRGPKVDWDDFGDLVRRQLKEANARELRKMLRSFNGIVEDHMSCLKEVKVEHPKPSIIGIEAYQPPTLEAIGFREIVSDIKTVKDRDCLATLIYFVGGLGQVSFGTEEGFEYYRDVLRWLNALYFCRGGDDELSGYIMTLTVESFRSGPFSSIRHLVDEERRDERVENVDLIVRYAKIYYTELCGILSKIWQKGNEQTFYELLDQLNSRIGVERGDAVARYKLEQQMFEHIKKNGTTKSDVGQKAYRKLEFIRIDVEIQDLRYLGDLAVSAWLAEVVGAGKMDAVRAKPLIDKSIGHISNFVRLIEACLYAASFGMHDSPLNYDSWDHERRIPGKVYTTGSTFEGWIQPFWILVALKRLSGEKQIEVDAKKIRLLSPFRDYHYGRLENAANRIVEDKDRYEWFAEGIDWDVAKERLLKIFQEIKELQKRMDFERLLAAPISQKIVENFNADCLKGYLGKRKLSELIKRFKSINKIESAEDWSGKPCVVDVLGKEEFIEDWHVGFAGRDAFGDFLGQIETLQFSKFIEDNLKEVGIVTTFGELPSLVKETASGMRDESFNPSVVLIPDDHRYQDCFTSTPDWKRTSEFVRSGLPEWVSDFDGMQVFVWPRWEQACVAIIDMDSFLALEEGSGGKYAPLDIQLSEVSSERMHALLENATNRQFKEEFESSSWNEATFAKTKLDLRGTANVRLGLVERAAGVKLALDENMVGVVCDKQKKICHGLNCELVNEINAEDKELYKTAALAVRGNGYQSCEKCRPLLGHYT